MPKRSSKPRDINELAAAIVETATNEEAQPQEEKREKNPHAAELGKLGGKKGGPARAAKLTPEQRKEIAKNAARMRWERKK